MNQLQNLTATLSKISSNIEQMEDKRPFVLSGLNKCHSFRLKYIYNGVSIYQTATDML